MLLSEKTVVPLGFAFILGAGVWWARGIDVAVANVVKVQGEQTESMKLLQDLRVEMAGMKTRMEETNNAIDRVRDFLRRKIK